MTDSELLAGFESAALSAAQWTHRAHVRVAYLLVRRHGLDEALWHMRSGLERLNQAHETPLALERGYHETVTRAWLHIVAALLSWQGAAESSEAFCDQHSFLMGSKLLRLYYSRERIMNWEAKARFLAPDLAPLPRIQAPAG